MSLRYKILIIVVSLICPRIGIWAQSGKVELNSTHSYRVNIINIEHQYKWTISDTGGNKLKFKKKNDTYIISDEGTITHAEGVPVIIKWEGVAEGEKYILTLTEEVIRSGCATTSEVELTIVNNKLFADFAKNGYTKCADENSDGFIIPILIKKIGIDNVIDISQNYPFTVEFYLSYNEGKEEVISLVLESGTEIIYEYVDVKYGFKENMQEDHFFKLRFKSMKDKYGVSMKVNSESRFVFKAIKNPVIKAIIFD